MGARPRNSHRIACLLAAAACYESGSALAQTVPPMVACAVSAPGPCLVSTRSGATFAGQLTALVPGSLLALRLATNEERQIPWADLISAIPATPAPAAAPVAELTDRPVPIVTDGMQPEMHLEQRPLGFSGEGRWGMVCQAPCQPLALHRGFAYHIVDTLRRGSPEFKLPPESGPLNLHVRPGSVSKRRLGQRLIVSGALLTALVPAIWFGVGRNEWVLNSPEATLGVQISMGVLGGVGLPLLGAGIGTYVTGSNRVTLIPTQSVR